MDLSLKFIETEIDSNETEEGLRTAILLSLYVDQRVEDDELEDNVENRGWWGDMFEESPYGSKLWTLEREKVTKEVINRYEQYAREALEWLIKDGIADSVSVKASFSGQNIYCEIEITRDEESFKYKFDNLWKKEEERNGI
jgi:phage gp46-like protein